MSKQHSVLDLQSMKADNRKIVMVTAYDYTMARLADAGGVDMVLVGDSLGMVIQGHEDTLPVTLDHMVYHTRCVSRGLKKAHLVADMPFMSWQRSIDQALASSGRLVQEGRAQSVKLEGGECAAETISKLVSTGIPVVGHVGLTPQSVHTMGGFRVQGRTDAGAQQVVADAIAVEQAGAFCVVLEGIPGDVAAEITQRLAVPTVGIGAGVHCDGQVLVCNDLLGMDGSFKPKFVKRFEELEAPITKAFARYAEEVRGEIFPGPEHAFRRKSGPRRVAKLY